jgi:curved DNA-binding protein CbpA
MDFDPLPPDPYNALGLTKDATAVAIKKAYRQLALRLHPDKCTDESQKATNIDAFHRIQQAYDLVGDEEKRARYDAQLRLTELRRQNMELRRDAPRGSGRAAAYEVRTAAPRGASYTTSRESTRGGVYDDRSARYYDYDEAPRASTRKAPEHEYANIKRSSPPRDRERERERERVNERERERARVSEREAEDRRRAERRREAEVRESRSRKYATTDEFEEDRRRRDRESEESRKKAEARKPEVHAYPATSNTTSSAQRKMEDAVREAMRHQQARNRPAAAERPATYRTSSSREVPRYEEAYTTRRSAAAPKERERSRRTSPGEHERKAPNLPTHASSPAAMEVPYPPPRSYTTQTNVDPLQKKSKEFSPPPFARAATMPVPPTTSVPSSSSKRKEAGAGQASKLRHSETAVPTQATYATPAGDGYTTKQYRYPDASAVPLRTESGSSSTYTYGKDYKAVLREPAGSSRRTRSPSPVASTRPASNTAAKMANLDPYRTGASRTAYVYPEAASVRPSMPHSSSARVVPAAAPRSSRSPERSSRRDRYSTEERRAPAPKLYGERTAPAYSSARGQPTSYRPEQVSYSRKIDPNDIIYAAGKASSRRDRDDFVKPAMQRSTTYAY